MGNYYFRVMEPNLEKLAIAIRTSQSTDASQNKVILTLGLVGVALAIAIGIYIFVKHRLEVRYDQPPQQVPLDRV